MDVSSIANTYATYGGVLVAFAFTGLSFYVTRAPEPDPGASHADVLITRCGDEMQITLISVSAVAAAGFYAMVSLGVSTFLYANLAGEDGAGQEGQAATALLVYGAVFALSVLTLFYFVTLMLFERPLTRRAAKPAFWAGTIAGSVLVLRFLAGSAQGARAMRCLDDRQCHPAWFYTTGGITALLAIAGAAFVVITLSRMLEWSALRPLLTFFMHRPTIAPAGVVVTAVIVAALVSLYINTRQRGYVPSGGLIASIYALGIAFIVVFALASGSVIYPRVHSIRLARLPASPSGQGLSLIRQWRRKIRIRDTNKTGNALICYIAGIEPVRLGSGKLMWKLPGTAGSAESRPSEIVTEFRVRHDNGPWQVKGRMFLRPAAANRDGAPSVHVTLAAASSFNEYLAVKDVSADPVTLKDSPRGTGCFLTLRARRTDTSPQDVLLCWFEAEGAIRPQPPQAESANAPVAGRSPLRESSP